MNKSYFSTTRKGEVYELSRDLQSGDKKKQVETVKKIIAAMTVGKDVSSLFPAVVSCIQTKNVELKKLVYLYLINYAKSQPDLAIMAVNTFIRDAESKNPLIKALALRTMGCIRVDTITEQLCDPLKNGLRDRDPYVRKTAAICVGKLYDTNPQLTEDYGFLDLLRDLMADSNPMVVANAVATISEIQGRHRERIFEITTGTLNKLLTAINECGEWGQVYILDALAQYTPDSAREAETVIERVLPRLHHKNSAVALSAIKVVLLYLDHVSSNDVIRSTCRKMAQPLVTLLHENPPEIQYVALRNISLVVQKRPAILQSMEYVKMFFAKYYDPIYVKIEKVDILVKLATDRNVDSVLSELKEYATEVDVDFVRKSVRAIGRCAIKLAHAAERCINVLLELIHTRINYVVQEAVIVIRDIFRKYPNRYETIIATLCENLEDLDEPEAKASMIWIIGEYADRIENADELLDAFLESFQDEQPEVQLAILTAVVKLFLKNQTQDTHEMLQIVLEESTQNTDNPDLRDRGYLYWRLVATDTARAAQIVLQERPTIVDTMGDIDVTLLERLVRQIGSLSSVYHKPPESFVSLQNVAYSDFSSESIEYIDEIIEDDSPGGDHAMPAGIMQSGETNYSMSQTVADDRDDEEGTTTRPVGLIDLLSLDGPTDIVDPIPVANAASGGSSGVTSLMDLMMGAGPSSGGGSGVADLMGNLAGIGGGASGSTSGAAAGSGPAKAAVKATKVLEASAGGGMEMTTGWSRVDGVVYYQVMVANQGQAPISNIQILFNKNSFGLKPDGQLGLTVPAGGSATGRIAVGTDGPVALMDPIMSIQVAVKNNISGDSFYFYQDMVPLDVLLTEGGELERDVFVQGWQHVGEAAAVQQVHSNVPIASADDVVTKLKLHNLFEIARKNQDGHEMIYFTCRTTNNVVLMVEVTINADAKAVRTVVRTPSAPVIAPFHAAIDYILHN